MKYFLEEIKKKIIYLPVNVDVIFCIWFVVIRKALNYVHIHLYIIVLFHDVFHIGLVIQNVGPRPAVLTWGAAECQYSRPRTYN
jgi:hypothetical protein